MVKECKEPNSQNSHQEEQIESEFGFVHDFFISEEKTTATDQPHEKRESELNLADPSVKFFLPDLFADEF